MKFTPARAHVLVEVITDQKTKGGLVLPDSAGRQSNKGRIVATPKDNSSEFADPYSSGCAKEGSVIIFKQAVQELELDGNKFLVVSDEDILGIVEE